MKYLNRDSNWAFLILFAFAVFTNIELQAGHHAPKNGVSKEDKPLPAISYTKGVAVKLFNGKDFSGWQGDRKWFRIEGGVIFAGSVTVDRIPHNYFLATDKKYHDFELNLKVKLNNSNPKRNINGGVQLRSVRVKGSTEMFGYQADIGTGVWGALYDESRRRKFLTDKVPAQTLKRIIQDGWNDYRIVCLQDRIQIYINGEKTCDYQEREKGLAESQGHIALQIHSAKHGIEIGYKDIVLYEITAN